VASPTVLVLGAAQHQIFTLTAIKAMGCRVVAIDRNPEAAGRAVADAFEAVDIADAERAIEVARRHSIDAVVPLSDYGVQTAAEVAAACGLPGNPPEVARNATSKARMRRLWEQAGVPSARFRVVRDLDAAIAATRQLDSWPLIFKPADSRGGGSRGISRVDGPSGVAAALEFAQSFYQDKDVVIEEFLAGVEHSLELVIEPGGRCTVLAISDKEKTPPPYRVDKSVIYPTAYTGRERERIGEVAILAARALGIEIGAAHVELCTTATGPRLFELGARFGGGHTPHPIVSFLTGINEIEVVTRLLLGEDPGPIQPIHESGAVYRFFTPPPGILESISGLEDVRRWEGVLDCGVWVGPGSRVQPVRTGGDRAGYVVAGASDRKSALELADRAESAIHFRYFDPSPADLRTPSAML
jgi:biotin carboxylase